MAGRINARLARLEAEAQSRNASQPGAVRLRSIDDLEMLPDWQLDLISEGKVKVYIAGRLVPDAPPGKIQTSEVQNEERFQD